MDHSVAGVFTNSSIWTCFCDNWPCEECWALLVYRLHLLAVFAFWWVYFFSLLPNILSTGEVLNYFSAFSACSHDSILLTHFTSMLEFVYSWSWDYSPLEIWDINFSFFINLVYNWTVLSVFLLWYNDIFNLQNC